MTKDMLFLLAMLTAGAMLLICFWLNNRLRQACFRQRLADERLTEYHRLLTAEQQPATDYEQSAVSGSAAGLPRERAFGGLLQQAGLRFRLQQGPRHPAGGVVDRYRLIAQMARRGLPADDISAILRVSGSEIEQLFKLVRLGRREV